MSLELECISHRFGAFSAVADASLEVEAGEIVCLVGHSGCGKTTLLRIAAGLERLQEGTIRLDNTVVAQPGAETPPEKRAIGFVFQDFVLFPHLTVQKNIEFGIVGQPQARNIVEEQIDALRLGGLERRYPHELSGGQQQRVALARALARRPRALLLDEPFASIDPVLRRALRDELRATLRRQAAAVLLVTHDPHEALALGDRIAFMRAGRIVEAAAPRDLYGGARTIEGAMVFPDRQRFDGAVGGGIFNCAAIGPIPAPGLADGAAAAAVLPGAIEATLNPAGDYTVADAHFVGPHWRALVVRASAPTIEVALAARPEVGASIRLVLDNTKVLVFSKA